MRWDDLFADLEAQAAHQARLDLEAEVADRAAGDVSGVDLLRRLPAADQVSVQLTDGSWVDGRVLTTGDRWFVLRRAGTGHQVLVPVAAVATVKGLGRHSSGPPGAVAARRTLSSALRSLAEAGERVLVLTRAGTVRGTVERCGADHVDVRADDRSTVTVSYGALLSVTGIVPAGG